MKYIKKIIKEYQSIDKVILILFFASVLALPSNLAKTWHPSFSYYQGIFIEYWAPKVFASQLLLLTLFILTTMMSIKKKVDLSYFLNTTVSGAKNRLFSPKGDLLLLLITAVTLGKSLFVEHPERFLTWLGTFFFGPFLLIFIVKKKQFLPYFPPALLAATSIQAVIGLIQVIFQKSLFPYQILGETQYDSLLFLAKSNVSNNVWVLPYGTTPHPNILGGWLVIGVFSLIILKKKLNTRIFFTLLILHLVVLVLTESFSAWATLAVGSLLILWRQKTPRVPDKKIQILLVLFSALFWTSLPVLLQNYWPGTPIPTSITRRAQPIQRFVTQPQGEVVFGSGLGQAFPSLNSSEDNRSLWKYPQPLHNSGIILVFELGLCTLLLLFIYFIFDVNSYSLFFWSILLSLPFFYLDHYITTQISGQYILTTLFLFFNFIHNYKRA